jgi:GNAT superfamily N-acetyltransferase
MTPDDRRAWTDRSRTRPVHVELVEVTHQSLTEVERLATHRSQRRFVATVAQSLADALIPEEHDGETAVPWYRAIVADGVITGFVMTTEPTRVGPTPYLWRLLVDRLHQRRGIGGMAVDLVIDRVRSLGAPAIEVSWVDGAGSPAPLYLGRGFVPTGDIDDGEIVARLDLTDNHPGPPVQAD